MSKEVYPFDTVEHQRSVKPYGFVDFTDDFFSVYLKKRENNVNILKKELSITSFNVGKGYLNNELEILDKFDTLKVMETLYWKLKRSESLDSVHLKHFFGILKKADLRKLTKGYDIHFKNISGNLSLENHALSALIFGMYSQSEKEGYLQALSTTLKRNDFLISRREMLKNQLGKIIMLTSLEMEKELIKKLREKINIRPLNPISFFRHPKKDPPVIIKNLGMLLQEGNRSKAYIQALVNSGLYPNFVLILKDPHHKDNLDTIPNERASNLFDPNISEIKVLKEAGIPYKLIIASSCDSPESIEELKSRPEEFFVFSGRGILNDVLKIGKELIHVHSGKLPDYRGSTCHFYSVLAGEGWWCTSFIMDLSVDQGEIITNREFSLPGKDIDDARIYDPYTRSMVLVDTIKQLAETGSLKTIPQDISKGIDYYIIHPVLGFIRRKFLDRFE